jgi:hypothetical protein
VDSVVFDLAVTVGTYGFALWLVLLFFQIMDFGAIIFDIRSARDHKLREREVRRRVTEYFWSIPATITLGLILALGIDYAGRLFFDLHHIREGLIVMVVLLFIALAGGLVIVYAMTRFETLTYATLRANLEEDMGERLTTAQVDTFRAQLEEVDRKHRHIRFGLRDRARMRRIRTELNDLADRYRTAPPVGLEAVGAISWSMVWVYLWRGNLLRVIAPLLALAMLLASVALSFVGGAGFLVFSLVLLLAFVVSSALALLSARASLASKTVWHAVYLKQRTDIEDLLIELEKASRKGVAGLGDRVAKALQILREQQE